MVLIKRFGIILTTLLIACGAAPQKSVNYGLDHGHQEQNVQVSKKIFIDSKFTAEEVEIIKKSTTAWENMSKGIIHFDLVLNFKLDELDPNKSPNQYLNKIIIKKSLSTDKLIQKIEKQVNEKLSEDNDDKTSKAIVLGYTLKKPEFEYIFIVSDRLVEDGPTKLIDPNLYQSVVMHELGHELGMEHYDDGPSIMNIQFDIIFAELTGTQQKDITCLTRHDAEQFCSLFTCDWTKLNYCE